jgi:hypothetical protein
MPLEVTRRSLCRLALVPAFLAALFAGLGSAPAAQAGEIFTNWGGQAIRGYDPVAYFTAGRPVEGSDDFAYEWLGATWQFASAEHRDMFIANPVAFMPQYGGYCAQAVAGGSVASIDPNAWRIVDGKLYLLYSTGALARWERNIPVKVASADANWPALRESLIE